MTTTEPGAKPNVRGGKRRPDLDSLYCLNEDGSRNTIHTADVRGRYQVRKKFIWAVLIAVYLVTPWVEVGGRPAILIDIPRRNFFLFGMSFNAQDFYLAFFLLTGIGFTLFVVSSLFGRIWCGYACPHSVFLEGVYRRVERWIEGGAAQRKKLAEMPWNAQKILRRGGKWAVYLAISLVLSHTFLSYFMGTEELLSAITNPPSEHPTAFLFIVAFTAIIYVNFTWFREQLCIVICPYGRLQGVLYDRDTINVTYDHVRGEPRGRYNDSERGDCIDCQRCIAVCPTGIDIRNGTQLECIGCANCIDACDEVMVKTGQPTGLIRYDSQSGIEGEQRRIVRPRLFLYAALLLIGITVFSVAASRRTPFESNLVRLQGPPFVVIEDTVRNSFFLHVVNKQPETRTFVVEPLNADDFQITMPIRQTELASMADTRLTVVVDTPRSRWQPEDRIELRVTTIDGEFEQIATAPLLGPR